MPSQIISDRDPVFTSAFWKELFKLSDTILNMSSACHLETDGQTECLNQCMEAFLHCFTHDALTKWASWLSLVEHLYNTSFHTTVRTSPFKALYEYVPRSFGVTTSALSYILEDALNEQASMTELLRQHVHKAKVRMKKQVDKHRMERSYAIMDQGSLKAKPYL